MLGSTVLYLKRSLKIGGKKKARNCVEIRKEVEGKIKPHRNKDKTGRSNKQYGKYC